MIVKPKGKSLPQKGTTTRILSNREAESFKYQWEGENPNAISMTFEEFQQKIKEVKK